MTSRTRAYDPDLCWRMGYQRMALELPFKTISRNLYADVSTVRRTGSMDKQPYPERHSRHRRKWTEVDQFQLLELVLERLGIYLHELRHELHASGAEASTSTICQSLHSCGLSRKKILSVALQRSEERRGRYVAEVTLHSLNMFVFMKRVAIVEMLCKYLAIPYEVSAVWLNGC